MDYRLCLNRNYLGAADLGGRDVTVEIASVEIEEIEGDKGKQKKGVVAFRKGSKKWILNRTNIECLARMFGPETKQWAGKNVTLFAARDKFGDELVDCVRVRGSPDIAADVEFRLKLPKKSSQRMVLKKTARQGKQEPVDESPDEEPADEMGELRKAALNHRGQP